MNPLKWHGVTGGHGVCCSNSLVASPHRPKWGRVGGKWGTKSRKSRKHHWWKDLPYIWLVWFNMVQNPIDYHTQLYTVLI